MLGRDKRTKGGGDDRPSVSSRGLSIPLVMGLNPFGFLVFLGLVIRARGGVAWTMGDIPLVAFGHRALLWFNPILSPLPYFPPWILFVGGGQVL